MYFVKGHRVKLQRNLLRRLAVVIGVALLAMVSGPGRGDCAEWLQGPAGNEFGNGINLTSGCTKPPHCLSGWYPFDECAGSVANDYAANRDGILPDLANGSTWTNDRFGACGALHIPASPVAWVTAPSAPENSFGKGSFVITAWVKVPPTSPMDPTVHTIVDKSNYAVFNPGNGVRLYVKGDRVCLQYGSQYPPRGLHPAPYPVDGLWHFVAVEVCRQDSLSAPGDFAQISVDATDTYFPRTEIFYGDIDVSVPVTIGASGQNIFNQHGAGLGGDIDDLQFYHCCLGPDRIVGLLYNLNGAFCREWCHVPPVVQTCDSTVDIELDVFNAAVNSNDYNWTISSVPGSSVPGVTYTPNMGMVYAPGGGTAGPGMGARTITVHLPGGMQQGQTTWYEVTVCNTITGQCFTCRGKIVHDCSEESNPGNNNRSDVRRVVSGVPTTIAFVIRNNGAAFYTSQYSVGGFSDDDDAANEVVRLNGLPPGTPVTGSVALSPGQQTTVTLQAVLDQFQPFTLHNVVLSLNLDGNPGLDDFAAVSLLSVTGDGVSGVPEVPVPALNGDRPPIIQASPNPFRESIGVAFSLGQPERDVRVVVFDVAGRLVRTLYSGPLDAGGQRFDWNGQDNAGRSAPNGIYFVRATYGRVTLGTRVVRVQ